jgi:hypothetical protein
MPILDKAVRWGTNRMPKVINPTAHAVIDYAIAASFLGMAVCSGSETNVRPSPALFVARPRY